MPPSLFQIVADEARPNRGQERLRRLQARIHAPEELAKRASHGLHDQPDGEMDKDEFAVHQVQSLADQPRKLAPEEQSDVSRYLSRWWPVRSAHDDTAPLYGRLASPKKSGVLGGLLGGGAGAAMGAFLNHLTPPTDDKHRTLASSGVEALQSATNSLVPGEMPKPAKGAILGALALGLPSAAMSYLARRSENQKVLGHMRRLPPGATLRDVPGYGSVYKPQTQVPAMAIPASVALGALLNFPEIGG